MEVGKRHLDIEWAELGVEPQAGFLAVGKRSDFPRVKERLLAVENPSWEVELQRLVCLEHD